MPPRKRTQNTPKRTPKRSRRTENVILPGGAMQTAFQLNGEYSQLNSVFICSHCIKFPLLCHHQLLRSHQHHVMCTFLWILEPALLLLKPAPLIVIWRGMTLL